MGAGGVGGDKLYFQIFQTIFFLMAYWKLAGPGVGWMAQVGSPHPGCPLLPSWACSAFPGGRWGPSQLGVSPLPPEREGTVAPLVHPRVGMVTCSVPWPGLCPHPAPAQLPWAPGGHRHPGHRAPTPHPSPSTCRASPSCCHATIPVPHGFQWSMDMLLCPQCSVPTQPRWPRWPPCPGLGAAQAQTLLGAPQGWQQGGSGRASPRGRGGRCLNTICFVEFGPAFRLTSLCTSLATSCRHSAGATHSPGHGTPQGVGTPWRSLYIASKRNKQKR